MSAIITEIYKGYRDSAGNNVIQARIACDTFADLPTTTAFAGAVLAIDSQAIVIDVASEYRLDSAGVWHLYQPGAADVYTRAQADALLAQRIPFAAQETIPATADLDTYTDPGTFEVLSGAAHTPISTSGRLDVLRISASVVQQRYTAPGSTTRVYYRNLQTLSPISWHPWAPIITGAYGIGTSISQGADLNTFTTYGAYVAASTSIAASCVHRPDYARASNKMFVLRVDANRFRAQQTLTAVDISSTYYGEIAVYIRIGESNGSQWGSWYQQTSAAVPDHT